MRKLSRSESLLPVKRNTSKAVWVSPWARANTSCSSTRLATTFWRSFMAWMAFILSRSRAASSNSKFSAACSIFSVSTFTELELPPLIKSTASWKASLYSASVTFPRQGAQHCLI